MGQYILLKIVHPRGRKKILDRCISDSFCEKMVSLELI